MQATVGRLPFPVDVLKILAVVDQQSPQFVENTFVVPATDRPMYGRVAAELFRQLIPLATRSGSIEHSIQAFSLVRTGATHTRRWVKFFQQRQEHVFPQRIGNLPNRGEDRTWLRGRVWLDKCAVDHT